jgi:hypothetical protein
MSLRRPDEPATSVLALNAGIAPAAAAKSSSRHPRLRQPPPRSEPNPPEPPADNRIGHNRGPPDDTVNIDDMMSMNLRDACRATGFSRDGMYDLIRTGEVKSFLLAGRRYILVRSLRDLVERLAAEPLTIRRGPNSRDGPVVECKNLRGRKSSNVRTS